jgi:hypothetical protein
MKRKTVRTSVDLPLDLHRRLREAAAKKGCSARQLIVAAIEQAISVHASQGEGYFWSAPFSLGSANRSRSQTKKSMSLAFPDVNVWLALSIEHVHQNAPLKWGNQHSGAIGLPVYAVGPASIADHVLGNGRQAAHDARCLEDL